MTHVVALLYGSISQPADISTKFFLRDVYFLSCKGSELVGCEIGCSVFEEYSLIKVIVVKFFLIEIVQSFVVTMNELWTQKVILSLGHLYDAVAFQERKVSLKSLSHIFVVLDVLDEEQLQNFFMNSRVDFFP